jgi:hypothetical protein
MALPSNIGSVNAELKQGAIDGTYKQVVKDRGGVVETLTYSQGRRDLSVSLYGIVEQADKSVPGTIGESFRSPYAVVTPDPGIQVTHQPS